MFVPKMVGRLARISSARWPPAGSRPARASPGD